MAKRSIDSWIKTPCGRAKYAELKSKTGVFSQIRLYWFVIFAALRDWNLSNKDQIEDSGS